MSDSGSDSRYPPRTKETGECGTLPRDRPSSPTLDDCSPSGDLRFDHLSTPPGGVDDEPPNTVDAKLEADALQQEQQKRSSLGLTQQQTHQELQEHARMWQQPLRQQQQLQQPQRQPEQQYPYSQNLGWYGPVYRPGCGIASRFRCR